ncbi:MAG: hypothetical protein RLZZ156_1666 [Deinococcota bacterium]|jgi:hypothetical protein
MSVRLYSYVGPKWIAEQLALQPIGFLISVPDVATLHRGLIGLGLMTKENGIFPRVTT